jgi:hypothetical protein
VTTPWRDENAWPAAYFDGQVATRHEVVARLSDEGLRIEYPFAQLIVWQYAGIRLPVDPAATETRLEYGSADEPESLLVDDPTFLDALAQRAPRLRGQPRPGRARHRWTHYAPIVAGAAAFLALIYAWGIPALANHMATRVPVTWEEGVGRAVVRSLVSTADSCAIPAGIGHILTTLLATVPETPYRMHVTVLDNETVNALAAPGGAIVVYRGLVESVQTPEELAGVLAHELQHVLLQHGTRAVLREVPVRIGISLITGGAGAPAVAMDVAANLGALRYRRGDEEAADREGMRMLQEAHIDPTGMIRFFDRLLARDGSRTGPLAYLSSHPQTVARVRQLTALASAAQYTPRSLMTDAEWAEVQAACDAPAPAP